MKVFHCDHCRQLVFFENTQCVRCGHLLAFLPDLMLIGSLESQDDANGLWMSPLPAAAAGYRLCENYSRAQVCNWAVSADDENPLCISCRLTRIIPDLSLPENHAAWHRLEVAKRRLVYTLLLLRLLPHGAATGQNPLEFRFLSDAAPGEPPVLTGHASGVITLSLAEADDAERERRRNALGEPYRTLLGHMRHESGHYYWPLLVESQAARLDQFRALFGDDSADYGDALQRHYKTGAPDNWQDRFVSAYASAHPWEDWAETWAHYLHIFDTLEIAASCGVSLRPPRANEPALPRVPADAVSPDGSFEHFMASWFPVTYLLNNLNRGLGLADAYPFVLSTPAIDKLRYVHDTVAAAISD